jgi:catechol 2,3-dioxygenase-like lactoylglutathione lyase family enzyme
MPVAPGSGASNGNMTATAGDGARGGAGAASQEAPINSAGATAAVPRMGFASFSTRDLDVSLEFYSNVFGMSEITRIPLGGGGMEVVMGYPDQPAQAGLVIMANPSQTGALEQGNAFSRFIFVVADIDATVEEFASRDLQVVTMPAAGSGFSYAIVRDPDGYTIELIEYD